MSVVVPFRGDEDSAQRLAASLALLDLGADDEVIVADNSTPPAFPLSAANPANPPRAEGLSSQGGQTLPSRGDTGRAPAVRAVRATGERSSYHARNAGASAAAGEWLLFMDADCVPSPDLISGYLAAEPDADIGALAGAVMTDPEQGHFLARYACDRGFLDQEAGLHTADDAAATANLMVRRRAFDELGGFVEGIRSGGDVDFCRRLTAAGWRIERRPKASVRHLHRESLGDLLGSIARYGAGASWLNDRYPGTAPQWPLAHGLRHCGRDIAANLARRHFEEAAFRGVDALGMFAHAIGYRSSNAAN